MTAPTKAPSLRRRALHATLVLLAVIPWSLGVLLFGVALLLVLLADKVWPNANWGNCWSYCGPKWVKEGGYLVGRPADNVRFLGRFWIPHVFWMPEIGDGNTVLQTFPVKRSKAKWLPLGTTYFEFIVRRKERPHNSNWADL